MKYEEWKLVEPTLFQKIIIFSLQRLNPINIRLLRSPLHRILSNSTMLVTFTGRRSGKEYTTPVSYIHYDNHIIFVTPYHFFWWKNLYKNPSVTLRIKGQDMSGCAEVVVEDTEAISEAIKLIIEQIPRDAKWYLINVDRNGVPNSEQLFQAARSHVLVRVAVESE